MGEWATGESRLESESEPFELVAGSLVDQISGIARAGWLEQEDMALLLRHRPVFHASRDHDQLTLMDLLRVVPKLEPEPAPEDQKQLILLLVVMPVERALDLGEFDHLAVQFGHDMRSPVGGEPRELLSQVDGVH